MENDTMSNDSGQDRRGIPNEKKKGLFKKLRERMKLTGFVASDEDDEAPLKPKSKRREKLTGNKNAYKDRRRIILGWIHDGIRCRLKTGGGTRCVNILKTAKKSDLLSEGIRLFFKNGRSKKGAVEEFNFDVLDYEENVLDPDNTVEQIHEQSGVPLLRFYICTTTKEKLDVSTNGDTADENAETLSLPDPAESNSDSDLNSSESVTNSGAAQVGDVALTTRTLCSSGVVQGLVGGNKLASAGDDSLPSLSSPRSRFTSDHRSEIATLQNLSPVANNFDLQSDDENGEIQIVKVSRANILNELPHIFKDPTIMSSHLKYEFSNELGCDEKGVSRDIYSSFWNEFFTHASEGEVGCVPVVNFKDWQTEEWHAIGKILAKGFTEHDYFPIRFSQAFVIAVIFGENLVTPEILMNSFLYYLCPFESNILKEALNGNVEPVHNEVYIDLLSRLGCRTIPKEGEVKAHILQLAHGKLIQETMYAWNAFAEVARTLLQLKLKTVSSVCELYDKLKPTSQKLISLVQCEPETKNQDKSYQFFLQYIRSQSENEDKLQKLTQFLTGADVICVDKICIEFTDMIGTGRRPIAHCCGPVLELPATYSSYKDLRLEFDAILSHDISFTMDIA